MNILKIKNIFPNSRVARFNVAVWQKSQQGSICFIGREVEHAGKIGEPDTGILKLFEVNENGKIIHERTIWKPLYDGINLEDPRALELNEALIIGITAVLRDKNGRPVPFPAIVKINSINSWTQSLPPFLIIDTFGSGKNITPVDDTTFLFRPDREEYNHKILVFSLHSQVPEKLGDIKFPTNLPWASWKIGTAMPPIWLSKKEALLIIHGITKKILDGKEIYIYSIGRAKLIKNKDKFKVIVSPEPLLGPDNFLNEDKTSLVEELHPEAKRVVYSCGGIINIKEKDTLSLYVNVGDRSTFEVEFLLDDLKANLF